MWCATLQDKLIPIVVVDLTIYVSVILGSVSPPDDVLCLLRYREEQSRKLS